MLLAFAMTAERQQHPESDRDSLNRAVFLASYRLESGREGAPVLFGPGADEARLAVVTAQDVADRVSRVPLPEVTADSLRTALAHAVSVARYWQDPDGEDLLTADEPVRHALHRVADHIAGSPHARWWTTNVDATDQWAVGHTSDRIDVRPPFAPGAVPPMKVPELTTAERLHAWHGDTVDREARAEREWPSDPTASWSDEWWSTPPVRCSTRRLFDGTPAGVWYVEDDMGWHRATGHRVTVPAGARVYEVDGVHAWAELCRRFAVEVTAQKRHDWYRTTGRSGRWCVPDWVRLADHYDGVHLTVAGYLAAAGTAIAVDADRSSVIGGWNPDETYWFTDEVDVGADTRTWLSDTSGEHISWTESHENL